MQSTTLAHSFGPLGLVTLSAIKIGVAHTRKVFDHNIASLSEVRVNLSVHAGARVFAKIGMLILRTHHPCSLEHCLHLALSSHSIWGMFAPIALVLADGVVVIFLE